MGPVLGTIDGSEWSRTTYRGASKLVLGRSIEVAVQSTQHGIRVFHCTSCTVTHWGGLMLSSECCDPARLTEADQHTPCCTPFDSPSDSTTSDGMEPVRSRRSVHPYSLLCRDRRVPQRTPLL